MTNLLQLCTLLIPCTVSNATGLPKVIHDVLSHLLAALERVSSESYGVGRFDATWKDYKAELALEEVIHSRPLSEIDD